MSITLKSWKILYDASITTDTSDISKYLDEIFTNLLVELMYHYF